jgi:hypothetical protein
VDWTELTQDRDQWDNAPLVSIKDGGIYWPAKRLSVYQEGLSHEADRSALYHKTQREIRSGATVAFGVCSERHDVCPSVHVNAMRNEPSGHQVRLLHNTKLNNAFDSAHQKTKK